MPTFTNNSILILQFNANGLKNYVNELQLVLQEKRIDIALISETHFTKHSYIPINGYNLHKSNHPDNTAHGGAAIYIKSSLMYQSIPNFCHPYLQSCAILLHLNYIPTTIAAIYSPPRHNVTIQNYVDYFSTLSHNFIIGGDYNTKHTNWGCRNNNPRGMVLYNFTNMKGYNISAPPGPTYWPTSLRKKPDILDIFVSNTPSNIYLTTGNLFEPTSDHSAVLITVSASQSVRSSPPKLFQSNTDKCKFHNLVDQNIDLKVSLKTTQEIDDAINQFTNVIQTAAWDATPTQMHFINNNIKIPEHIRILTANKRRARAQYQRSRLPSHKRYFNNMANSLKKTLAEHNDQLQVNYLTNLSPKTNLWEATKKLLKHSVPNTPLIKPDGGFTSSDVEKAELLKSHLVETFILVLTSHYDTKSTKY